MQTVHRVPCYNHDHSQLQSRGISERGYSYFTDTVKAPLAAVIANVQPIIYYFAVATSVDPIPFLTAEFTAANIWSMLLFVGNPTNIIVALAFQMSFADYSKWMALPTLGEWGE